MVFLPYANTPINHLEFEQQNDDPDQKNFPLENQYHEKFLYQQHKNLELFDLFYSQSNIVLQFIHLHIVLLLYFL